jgi:perosamine synthetase
MTNIQAAIGLGQLERIDHHLGQRRRVAAAYRERLAGLQDKLVLPVSENWAEHVYWMYTVMLRDGVKKSRDQVMADLDAENIETRPVFYPMHVLPPYQDLGRPGAFPTADWNAGQGINLPTFGALTDADIDRVASALERSLA